MPFSLAEAIPLSAGFEIKTEAKGATQIGTVALGFCIGLVVAIVLLDVFQIKAHLVHGFNNVKYRFSTKRVGSLSDVTRLSSISLRSNDSQETENWAKQKTFRPKYYKRT